MRVRLKEAAGLFLRLGFTAFGGPAAHLALMEREAVDRRGWLDRKAYWDRVGLVQLAPGPSSTQVALWLGWERAGWRGLLVAGAGFILPAAGIVLALAWAYVRFGSLPAARGALAGLQAAVLAVVLLALRSYGKTVLADRRAWVLASSALLAAALGLGPLPVVLGAGLAAWALEARPRSAPALAALPLPFSQAKLFWIFLKVGAVLYGSGYVLLAYLRAELVAGRHWLTEAQLLDAIAVGQFTPGPVFTTATFVGYLVGSWKGAALATLGIFLPSFAVVPLLVRFEARLRGNRGFRAFLGGVNAGSVALLAWVALQLGRAALAGPGRIAVFLAALAVLARAKLNPTWVMLGAAAAGILLFS